MDRTWQEVDDYFNEKLATSDDVMDQILKTNEEAGLPSIEVSKAQGKMLYLLAKMSEASSMLEIGTHGGFSSVWMARALPEEGRLVTLEADETHAEVARRNIEAAGLDEKVDVIEGQALDTLPTLLEKGYPRFGFIFIDANKDQYPEYMEWALKHSSTGTVIVADNVVRQGRIIEETDEKDISCMRRMFDMLEADDRLETTAIQTVGQKGHDGFLMGVVK